MQRFSHFCHVRYPFPCCLRPSNAARLRRSGDRRGLFGNIPPAPKQAGVVGALRASPAAAGTVGERLPRGAGALQAMAGAGRRSARDRRGDPGTNGSAGTLPGGVGGPATLGAGFVGKSAFRIYSPGATHGFHGSIRATSISVKSLVLRVTKVRSCCRATAAICASPIGFGRPVLSPSPMISPQITARLLIERKDAPLKLSGQIMIDPPLETLPLHLVLHTVGAAHQFSDAHRCKEEVIRPLVAKPSYHTGGGARFERFADHVCVDQECHYSRSTQRPVD